KGVLREVSSFLRERFNCIGKQKRTNQECVISAKFACINTYIELDRGHCCQLIPYHTKTVILLAQTITYLLP
ncbi:hypothetical protein GBAR_LOCUS12867, partial [Geodia barretti]